MAQMYTKTSYFESSTSLTNMHVCNTFYRLIKHTSSITLQELDLLLIQFLKVLFTPNILILDFLNKIC
jgi:hypothetical protein